MSSFLTLSCREKNKNGKIFHWKQLLIKGQGKDFAQHFSQADLLHFFFSYFIIYEVRAKLMKIKIN